jgi:hypothetical protein
MRAAANPRAARGRGSSKSSDLDQYAAVPLPQTCARLGFGRPMNNIPDTQTSLFYSIGGTNAVRGLRINTYADDVIGSGFGLDT